MSLNGDGHRNGVKEFMTRGVPTVGPDTEFRDAIRRLRSSPVGLVAVCDRGRLVGTLTERDMTREPTRISPRQHVSEVIQPDLSYCFEDTDIEEAVRLMRDSGLDQVVVLDRRGQAVGTLSLEKVTHRPQ